MPQTSVGSRIDKPLDIQRHFFTEISLNPVIAFNDLAQPDDLVFTQILDPNRPVDARLFEDLQSGRPSDSKNVRQTDIGPLLSW